MKTLLVGVNAKYIHSSLAVYSLSAACRARGQQVETVEYTINHELMFVFRDIAKRNVDLIGFACYIWNIEFVLKLVSLLHLIRPNLVIVLGGPEVSFVAADVLGENPGVRFVVRGEGEESLAELVQAIQAGGKYPKVNGVAGRNADGSVAAGEQRVVENLDNLPFPYTEENMSNLQNRILYYESSRGCPFSCSYCLSAQTRGVRHRSINKVEEDLGFLLQAGVRQIKFVDRTFNVRPEHYRQIWRFLTQRVELTNFHFEIVADRLMPEDFEVLSHIPPGRIQFEIGIQTMRPETLTAIGRQHDRALLEANVRQLRDMRSIHLHLDLIAGLPYESYAGFRESFNAVFAMQPDMLQLGFLKMLPGAPICNESEKYGYLFAPLPPYEVLANRYLTFEDVGRLKQMEEVLESTYNSGCFSGALSYLVHLWHGDAFRFFEDFSRWWEEEGLFSVSHGAEAILETIRRFAESRLPAGQNLWVSELLKFDVLMDATGALRGVRLDWNGEWLYEEKSKFWRDEERVRRYDPDYRFTNWRDVKRRWPVEVFSTAVTDWLCKQECDNRPIAILFIKGEGRVARWVALAADDLPVGVG